MLISFSVTNFRSIETKQTLSLLSCSSSELLENTFTLKLPGHKRKNTCSLLKTAALFGPNASGKSTFIRAMGHVRQFIIDAARIQRGDEIEWVEPFRLSAKAAAAPSVFEVAFVAGGKQPIKYEYGFAVTGKRIVGEWLFEYRSSRPTRLFSRSYAKHKYKWVFGEGFRAGDIHERTLECVPFLSKAAVRVHGGLVTKIFPRIHSSVHGRRNSSLLARSLPSASY